MRFFEIKPTKPLTPQQQRIKSLQMQKNDVSKQLKAEKDRQMIQRAQHTIQSVVASK
jgi:predicted ATP-binding protein involved in virulence